MTYSMTGYGKATAQYDDKTYTVEIKTLNAKNSDVRMRVPVGFREYEIKLRQYILDKIVRGKTEMSLSVMADENDIENSLNVPLFKKYYKDLSELSNELKIENSDFVQSILRIPNIIKSSEYALSDSEWKFILNLCDKAVEDLNRFRKDEGTVLYNDLLSSIKQIEKLLKDITPYEEARIQQQREKMLKGLREHMSEQTVDHNRFEQEIIYYIEKLDIHEEKVRLSQHCKYFDEEINAPGISKGKKLGFLAQEIGREINTIGSKAQYSEIQKIVVEMKNELDQIREQLANLL
ncbi:MAG: YicC family protein [Saprospiraceae bacterium]|nr:YicC family protein [Saprospiraceae bacterium]|tara:strand:- start:3420 stop:4295 length:876 start_codon:yes stop_codon:yes gene_type:complete